MPSCRVAHETSTGGSIPGTARAPTLSGRRVVLRAVRPDDVPDIVDISAYDGATAADEGEALAMLRRIEADAERGETVHWGICLAGGDTVVGTIGFYRGFRAGTGEVGYVMRSPFRRRGLMREALALAVAHGFGPLGLATVEARTAPDNTASIGLLGRLGFALQPSDGAFLTFALRPAPARIATNRRG
jgi:ribosomal-protein-alanine N-acetyltransferase